MKFIVRVDQNKISHSFALFTGEISWSKFIFAFVILVIYIRSKTIRHIYKKRVIQVYLLISQYTGYMYSMKSYFKVYMQPDFEAIWGFLQN